MSNKLSLVNISLPSFPDFTSLLLEHESIIVDILTNKNVLSSDYAFYNLWGWYKTKPTKISKFKDSFLIFAVEGPTNDCLILPPIGFGNIQECVNEIILFLNKQGCDKTLSYVPKVIKDEIVQVFPSVEVVAQENYFDYIYSRKDLAELSGRKYHQKKNFVNRVIDEYSPKIEMYTERMYPEVMKFLEEWYKDFGLVDETTQVEKLALERCIKVISKINAIGIVIKINNAIVGFSIASKLTENCWIVTVEKANRHYKGLYQYLNWVTANYIPNNVTLINRESDLGIEGLKQAKKSYHPVMYEEKFKINFEKL